MKITIQFDDDKKSIINLSVPERMMREQHEKYPEVGMMLAMEECNELAMAVSKCVRNGSDDKKDNLAEEIVDVLLMIEYMILNFNVTPEMLGKWSAPKIQRYISRYHADDNVFRSSDAKTKYESTKLDNPKESILITRKDNGKYEVTGDYENIAEYYHVLKTYMSENNPLFDNISDAFIDSYLDPPEPPESPAMKEIDKSYKAEIDKILKKAMQKSKEKDKSKNKKGKKGKK